MMANSYNIRTPCTGFTLSYTGSQGHQASTRLRLILVLELNVQWTRQEVTTGKERPKGPPWSK